MALITCGECKKEVSSNADRCPFCGNPIKNGFLGKAGTSRVLNVGCLLIILVFVALIMLGSCSTLLLR
jgi:hypothetical protein